MHNLLNLKVLDYDDQLLDKVVWSNKFEFLVNKASLHILRLIVANLTLPE